MLYYHNEILQIEYVEETDNEGEEEEGKEEHSVIEINDDVKVNKDTQEKVMDAAADNNNVTKLEARVSDNVGEDMVPEKKVKEGVDFHYIESLLGNQQGQLGAQ